MKQLVEGGADHMLPPTKEEVKEWKTFYLLYFNSEKSIKEGRRLPKSLCVKNPRPDEVSEALGKLGFRSICDHVSFLCC
jgi:hypothetical protein